MRTSGSDVIAWVHEHIPSRRHNGSGFSLERRVRRERSNLLEHKNKEHAEFHHDLQVRQSELEEGRQKKKKKKKKKISMFTSKGSS